jgi:uncharacterized membrane protein YgdD (TMEM256/DUF423 family)
VTIYGYRSFHTSTYLIVGTTEGTTEIFCSDFRIIREAISFVGLVVFAGRITVYNRAQIYKALVVANTSFVRKVLRLI